MNSGVACLGSPMDMLTGVYAAFARLSLNNAASFWNGYGCSRARLGFIGFGNNRGSRRVSLELGYWSWDYKGHGANGEDERGRDHRVADRRLGVRPHMVPVPDSPGGRRIR